MITHFRKTKLNKGHKSLRNHTHTDTETQREIETERDTHREK